MQGRAWDLAFGLIFAALGAGLALQGCRLPEGLAGVPGPGFFPVLVGGALFLLGVGLAIVAPRQRAVYWDRGWRDTPLRQVLAVVALLTAYAAAWDLVPFVWRTGVLLLAIYLVLRESLARSVLLAIAITAALAGVFEALFRVRL